MTPEQREQQAREFLRDTLGLPVVAWEDIHATMGFLAKTERAVLEEVAEHHDAEADNWNPFPVAMPSEYTEAIAWSRQQARAQEAAELAGWCRQQIKERS